MPCNIAQLIKTNCHSNLYAVTMRTAVKMPQHNRLHP